MPKRQLKIENHKRVYAHLRKAGAPLSAYQILEAMHADGFRAPVTVYRALERLMGEGRIHRVESLNAFVPCCDPDHRHGFQSDAGRPAQLDLQRVKPIGDRVA